MPDGSRILSYLRRTSLVASHELGTWAKYWSLHRSLGRHSWAHIVSHRVLISHSYKATCLVILACEPWRDHLQRPRFRLPRWPISSGLRWKRRSEQTPSGRVSNTGDAMAPRGARALLAVVRPDRGALPSCPGEERTEWRRPKQYRHLIPANELPTSGLRSSPCLKCSMTIRPAARAF